MKQINKQLFIRDVSWLVFNDRVLQEAQDKSNTIHDRLRFLGIFSNNQDEFFRVRVAALTRMKRLGKAAKMHLEENPGKILKKVTDKVRAQSKEFDSTYAGIIKEMAAQKVYIKNEKQLNKEQQEFIKKYFSDRVRTQLVPLMIESIPKAPPLKDKAIYLACMLGNSEHSLMHRYAMIEIPTKVLPRFILLPSNENRTDIILLEDIIRFNLPSIFSPFGFDQFLGYIIKVTRDAEFTLDHDVNVSLIDALEEGIKNRKKGKATRFVYDKSIDQGLLDYLVKRLLITSKDAMIPGGRIHNFKDFMDFPDVFQEKKHRRKSISHPLLQQPCRIMDVIGAQDVLLNFPYHTFDPLIDLLREAAIDPFVTTIKITCYRSAKDSKIMNALINAVRNGKDVTAILEVRARFDEEANLEWKERLEDAGVKVHLGIANMKVHAKLCVIKKREFNKIKQYGFISTGNFNENTAKYYGDHCLMTSHPRILADVNRIFNYLEKPTEDMKMLRQCKMLVVSPINTRNNWLKLIDKEISYAKKKKKAQIIIKLNSLVDEKLIYKLYEAAKAGVEVRMIVRGIFCAIPQQRGFKKDLEAISIVDEYLEHARVIVFHNVGERKVFISSADWMMRNLDHRVEATTPILDKNLQQELVDILNIQWKENVKARILDNQQLNKYIVPKKSEELVRSQVAIFDYLQEKAHTYNQIDKNQEEKIEN